MDRPPPNDRRRHLTWLAFALAIPALALVLEVRGATAVGVRGLMSFNLPEVCALRRTLDVPCPGCGLTRSVIRLMHGDVAGSIAMHPLGWFVLGAILFQIPYRLLALAGREPQWTRHAAVGRAFWLTLFVLLLFNWAFVLLRWRGV